MLNIPYRPNEFKWLLKPRLHFFKGDFLLVIYVFRHRIILKMKSHSLKSLPERNR